MNKPMTLTPEEVASMLSPAETSAWFSAETRGEKLPHENMKVQLTDRTELALIDETNRTVMTIVNDGTLPFEKGCLLMMRMLYNQLVGRTLGA